MTIGEYLSELRAKFGYSKAEAARRVRVSRVSYHMWEAGKTVPGALSIRYLARVYRVKPSALLKLLPRKA